MSDSSTHSDTPPAIHLDTQEHMQAHMPSQQAMDYMLTLAIPLSLVEEVSDFLLLNPQWASGFSIIDAQGMGQGAALLSAIEKVQGRSKRKLVLVVGAGQQLKQLVSALKEKIRNSDVAYWLTPVSDFGRF